MGRAKLDVHARLMRKYPKTPWYWFLAITLVMVALTIVMVTVYDTKLPWWAVLITTIFPALYIVPCGIIQGITNQDVNTLNVMAEFAAGYMVISSNFSFSHQRVACSLVADQICSLTENLSQT